MAIGLNSSRRWLDTARKSTLPYTPSNDELASMMRAFRDKHSLNAQKAGEWLGLSSRTIEGIEQGRGHSAGRLLAIALASLTSQSFLKDPVDKIR